MTLKKEQLALQKISLFCVKKHVKIMLPPEKPIPSEEYKHEPRTYEEVHKRKVQRQDAIAKIRKQRNLK